MAWQSVAMERQQQWDPGTHERLWTWQQHEEAVYRGAHGRLGAWQQQLWEARNLPAPYVKKFNTPAVCEET
ncbi:unnamed protein product [Staurois parvus]|uniref:Uncharacterized protein n=1 Tax=Staurois parvus TaxID=386267 RepID=A0ABN9EQ02_9NEOB|nr:unnamed protein product [Staurois parvus]